MSGLGIGFHRQYVRVFSSTSEVEGFVKRNADARAPWFQINDVKVRMISMGSYTIERYVVLYTAQEPLS